MNKEEIQSKLDEATKRRMEISDNILGLKEQLAEAEKLEKLDKFLEKPKLRHGDFGMWKLEPAYAQRSAIYVNNSCVEDAIFYDATQYCTKASKDDGRELIVFGNVFELMKGWDKPFEHYHSQKGCNYDTDTDLTIVIDINDRRPDKIWIGTCGNSAWYPRKDAEKIWHELGHAIAELKRKK